MPGAVMAWPIRRRYAIVAAAAGVVLVGGAALLFWLHDRGQGRPPRQDAGSLVGVAFVSDSACAACHAREARAWTGSHHDWAMKPATAETVLADFDDARFEALGVTTRFFKRGDRFFVNAEGADGRTADFEIRYTFGYTPLQQYLVEFPGGRLQSLTIAWDVKGRRWFSLYPGERIKPGDPLHWTGRYQTWNLMCADCHSTNVRKNYDSETDTYRTVWSEITVGCQACHGPGGAHVAWAERASRGGAKARPPGAAAAGLTVDARDPTREADTCAPCHARRHRVAPEGAPAKALLDTWVPTPLRPGLYWPDGQQRDEVYVHGSFLQSRMHARGVRCTDCHDPHTLKTRAPGNALCTTCHRPDPPPRFPLPRPKVYDSPAHHFHRPDGPGARCVDCHMPQQTYMEVDPRRDHSFPVPRPDLTVKLGVPNACTGCHADRTPAWAAATAARWYPGGRQSVPHAAEILAAAWAGRREAARPLGALATDRAAAPFLRASALDALRRHGREGAAAALASTGDPDPMVRLEAVAALDALGASAARTKAVAPLLADPVRAVRMEAARVLAGVARGDLTAEQRRQLDAGLAEFRAAQAALADTPGAWLNLAVLASATGDRAEAERLYARALALDPGFVPASANLATLYAEVGRPADAERVLRAALGRAPGEGELHYSLGLLLAETERLPEAAEALGRAAALVPDRARAHYNHGLALQRLGRAPDAEAALRRAHDADPGDPDVAYALGVFFFQQGRLADARRWAERAVALAPGAPGPAELLRQIREARARPTR
jgi:tetratricopeptide (TPR) repeat protein